MNPISRTQAWCKLAVLIADGHLPAPRGIDFHDDDTMIWVREPDSAVAYAWARYFGTDETLEHFSTRICQDWNGYNVYLAHGIASPELPDPEPVTEDMTAVREIAAAVSE